MRIERDHAKPSTYDPQESQVLLAGEHQTTIRHTGENDPQRAAFVDQRWRELKREARRRRN